MEKGIKNLHICGGKAQGGQSADHLHGEVDEMVAGMGGWSSPESHQHRKKKVTRELLRRRNGLK